MSLEYVAKVPIYFQSTIICCPHFKQPTHANVTYETYVNCRLNVASLEQYVRTLPGHISCKFLTVHCFGLGHASFGARQQEEQE